MWAGAAGGAGELKQRRQELREVASCLVEWVFGASSLQPSLLGVCQTFKANKAQNMKAVQKRKAKLVKVQSGFVLAC